MAIECKADALEDERDALLAALIAVRPMWDCDVAGFPEDDTVGWDECGEIPVTFKHVREANALIAKYEKEPLVNG